MSDSTYESYPFSIVCLSTVQTIVSYAIGAFIFYLTVGFWLALSYILLCIALFWMAMRFRCSYCYYYGKKCPTGLGNLCKSLFKKGDSTEFGNPKNVKPVAVPSFTLMFLPLIVGLIYAFVSFSWFLLLSLIAYFVVAVNTGFLLRKNILCKSCKQREIGCPAYEGMKGEKSNIPG